MDVDSASNCCPACSTATLGAIPLSVTAPATLRSPPDALRDARAAVGRCPRLALSLVTSTSKNDERQANRPSPRDRLVPGHLVVDGHGAA